MVKPAVGGGKIWWGARRIDLVIDCGKLSASVEGTNATWVFGQAARLEMIILSARGSTEPASLSRTDFGTFVFIALSGVLLLFYGVASLVGGLFVIGNSLTGAVMLKRRRTARLNVTTPLPPRGIREHLALAGQITTYNLVIAAVAAAATVVAAFK